MTGFEIGALIAMAVGAATGIYQGYQQNKAMKQQAKQAEQQFELAKKQAQEEEQARNKADQKEVDIEGLINEYSFADLGQTNLTGARGKERVNNPLAKKSALLGGGIKKWEK